MKHTIPKTIFGKQVDGAIKRALAEGSSNGNSSVVQPALSINPFDSADESFIMSYDHPKHKQFFQELIRKSNERFKGTKAEIPLIDSNKQALIGEVKNMYAVKRMALISTLANNQNLSNCGLCPISPLQSEALLKSGKLPDPSRYWEDLGLILYDIEGENKKEAKFLRESIKGNLSALSLSESDLEKKLLVVHAGAEPDSKMPYGVRPIIIPGITKIYTPDILNQIGQNHIFEYGLDNGVPFSNQVGKGKRTLYMPDGDKIGLRLLCRGRGLGLDAGDWNLACSFGSGRVNFAPKARNSS